MSTMPFPATSGVTSNSYHWPFATLPRELMLVDPNTGLVFHATVDSDQVPVTDRVLPPDAEGLLQKRRSLALATPAVPTPVTANRKSPRSAGFASSEIALVPKFIEPLSWRM